MKEETEINTTIRPGAGPDRVGLFGGTFNPVHLGHIEIARDVKKGFPLDKIIVIPSASPPHKKVDGLASAEDRLEMVECCFKDLDGFEVSDIELKRQGLSYTIDTVNELYEAQPTESELYLMIGTDAFFEIHTWRRYRELLARIPLIIMPRPGDGMETVSQKKEKAGLYLSQKISDDYDWNASSHTFESDTLKTICFYDVTPLDISSTQIRQLIRTNRPVSASFLDSVVAAYINQKGLYT